MVAFYNEVEANNTFASANYPGLFYGSNSNVIVNGSISSGDVDTYIVYANAGTRISARAIATDFSGLDSTIAIYNSSGAQVAGYTYPGDIGGDDFDSSRDPYVSYSAPTTSYYYVQIKGFNAGYTGSYNLVLSNTNSTPATSGGDTIYGTSGADLLVGGAGGDFLYGFEGGDVIDPGTGDDYAYGYAGDDLFIQRSEASSSSTDQYFGMDGNDTLNLYPSNFYANNYLIDYGAAYGYNGRAFLNRQYGGLSISNNIILDSFENVDAAGGNLNDSFIVRNLLGSSLAAAGSQIVFRAGSGNDYLDGTSTTTRLISFGDDGADTLIGGLADDNLFGGIGNDVLIGGGGNDGLSGDDGNDRINAGDGNDLVLGGSGADELGGGTGNDTILGEAGTDTLFGEAGDDRMNGGADNDILVGGAGNDELGGGSGDDTLIGDADNDTLFGEDGNDRLNGGSGNDTLVGNLGNDELGGDDGDDVLVGNEGTDTLFGGFGNDQLNAGSEADVVLGNEGNDILGGGGGNDVLSGGADQDSLFGEDGNDTLDGGTGNDVLIGGSGADQYNFGSNSGSDIINGFNAAEGDRLALFGQSYVMLQDQYGNATLALSGGGFVTLSGISPGQVNPGYFA